LFVEPALSTALNLDLNGAYVSVLVSDCGKPISAPAPIPCLYNTGFYTYERHESENVPLPVPVGLHRGSHDRGNSISLVYEWSGELLKTRKVLARDLLMHTPLRLSVCGYYPRAVSADQVQKITRMLPESITFTLDEKEVDEQTGSDGGGNRVTGIIPWTTHSYRLIRGETVYGYCADTNYQQ